MNVDDIIVLLITLFVLIDIIYYLSRLIKCCVSRAINGDGYTPNLAIVQIKLTRIS